METLVLFFVDVLSIPRLLHQTKALLVSQFINVCNEILQIEQKHLETIEECRNKLSVLKLDEEIEPDFSEKYQTGTSTNHSRGGYIS